MERYRLTWEELQESIIKLTIELVIAIAFFLYAVISSSEPWNLLAYQHFGTSCCFFCFGQVFPEIFRGHLGWSIFARILLCGVPYFAYLFPFLIIGRYIWFVLCWRKARFY